MDLHGNFARNELLQVPVRKNGTKLERSYTYNLLCIYPLTDNRADTAGQRLRNLIKNHECEFLPNVTGCIDKESIRSKRDQISFSHALIMLDCRLRP